MKNTAEGLVALCEIFAVHTHRSLSTVSRLATGSGETIARLQRDCAITTRRAENAFQYLSDHWPSDLAWPSGTPRPDPSEKEAA